MSGNPFDAFASEMRAAIPSAAATNNGIPESAPTTTTASTKPMVMNTFAPPPAASSGYPAPYMMQQAPPNMGYPGVPPIQQQSTVQPMGYPPVMPPPAGMMGAPPVPPSLSSGPPMGMMAPHSGPPMGMMPPPWGMAPPTTAAGPTMGVPPGPGSMVPPISANSNAMVPSSMPSNPYASMLGNTMPPPPAGPYGGGMMAPPPGSYGMAPPLMQPPAPSMAPPVTPVVPQGYPMAPTAMAPAPPVLAPASSATFDPMSTHDPWGPGPATTSSSSNVVGHYSGGVSDDPFGVFGTGAPPAQPPSAPHSYPVSVPYHAPPMIDNDDGPVAPPSMSQSQVLAAADDFWGDMGFSPVPASNHPAPSSSNYGSQGGGQGLGSEMISSGVPSNTSSTLSNHKAGELPPGGEWYDARIFTPTLGVMFFKPKELVDSLFLQTDPELVETLEERPVVAFIVEGSSARSAGVELGHVLLKVNGIDVKNPKEASRLIKEGPRPLPLLFYVPDTTVVVAEGEHMVKYDTRDTGAPNSAKDWKPKYVVIGGIIAQPWMMNMYRSKSEYDIAVIETQARRPVSVKVKQFSLQGARILNDWQGPQVVKYKNKLHPWKYIVVMPVGRNPIKISAENLTQLKPVHEGIRRVLAVQQRNAPAVGGGGMTRADPYGRPYPEEDPNPPNYYNTQSQMMQSSQQQQQPPQYSNYPPSQPFQYPNEGGGNTGTGEQPNGISGGTASVRRRQE